MRLQYPSLVRVVCFVAFLFPFVNGPGRAQTNVPARITQAVDPRLTLTLRGNTHPLARPENDRGLVADAQPLNRILLLLQRSPDQEAALQQFLEDQQNKLSPNYHRWLTPEQFGQQYGPADADIQTITDWLQSQGFTQVKLGRGRTVIEFSGNAAQVRNAFHADMRHYVVNGQRHMANATDPQIPAALASVVAGVVSLHNFPVKSHARRLGTFQKSIKTGEIKPLFTFPGCQSGNCYALGPPDFAVIYNTLPLLNGTPKIDGTGQTIAVVGETNINVQDVSDFRTIFGLAQNFTTQNVILNGPDPGINGSETESDLDIQWAGAVAPGATIDFVTSAPTETTSGVHLSALYAVDNNLAGVLSESFGECERFLGTAGNQFYNALWQQAAAQGITVILSSGDGGSAGCDNFDTQQTANLGLAVSGFASTPFNVAVGGTDFDQIGRESQFWNTTPTTTTPPVPASALKYIPEVPWNDTCAQLGLSGCGGASTNIPLNIVAGSGGASSVYAKPSWQMGYPGVPNDSHRDLPDVSLFASNGFNGSFYIICQRDITNVGSCNLNELSFTFQGLGGTSASAPAFAGIMALVNQKMGSRQGNANYVLYALAKRPGASCNSNGSAPRRRPAPSTT
jgi:subtilase family serine protease